MGVSSAELSMAASKTAHSSGSLDPIYPLLVSNPRDVVGLIAFCLHEQQVKDWSQSMRETLGRAPTESERTIFRMSEATPRRLQAYRYLAQARLDGRGPDFAPHSAKASFLARTATAPQRRARPLQWWHRLSAQWNNHRLGTGMSVLVFFATVILLLPSR